MKAANRPNRTILAQFPALYLVAEILSNWLFVSIIGSARREVDANRRGKVPHRLAAGVADAVLRRCLGDKDTGYRPAGSAP